MEGKELTKYATANLILLHNIGEPTEQQIALYCLYGENASSLHHKEQTQTVDTPTQGDYKMKKLDEILTELRGTKQLLTLVCNEITEVKGNAFFGNPQESLFAIEDMLKRNIADLEALVYSK